MSALGQKRTYAVRKRMSALTPKADIAHKPMSAKCQKRTFSFIRSLTLGDHQHPDKSSIVYRTSHIGLTFGHVAAHNGTRSQIVSCAPGGPDLSDWMLTNSTALKHSRISSGVPRKLYEGSLAHGSG